ncbi:Phenylacetic acid catabolic protein [Bartonella sp. HY406]|uniref:Phenylacetic acid catabolic protein n=1 Tax=Bartonella sp. HY406 TaxID=2979331 RepID=UPI0021C60F8B|nr:Phenylacetic acid catabolic protein [Bartonella sp. HY406]UXN04938.1 phenylacetate-CoA oxygenase subunit PaaI [Bartonella sp. HY406]
MTGQKIGERDLGEFLKNGGLLLSPEEVLEPYRSELIQIMAAFFDSELAVSAGFVDLLNMAPNINLRINVARLVVEKAEHAKAILDMMRDFGEEGQEYQNRVNNEKGFNWAARLDRGDNGAMPNVINLDKRVNVLYYPYENWPDAVMMYVVMEKAAHILISELSKIFYKPLAMACQLVMTSERQHSYLSRKELLRLAKGSMKTGDLGKIEASLDYWLFRARANFDSVNLPYFERLRALGLPHRSNQEMLAKFNIKADELRQSLNLVSRL